MPVRITGGKSTSMPMVADADSVLGTRHLFAVDLEIRAITAEEAQIIKGELAKSFDLEAVRMEYYQIGPKGSGFFTFLPLWRVSEQDIDKSSENLARFVAFVTWDSIGKCTGDITVRVRPYIKEVPPYTFLLGVDVYEADVKLSYTTGSTHVCAAGCDDGGFEE